MALSGYGEPKNEQELFEILRSGLNRIDPKYLRSLVDSMPRRIQLVIKARGNAIEY